MWKRNAVIFRLPLDIMRNLFLTVFTLLFSLLSGVGSAMAQRVDSVDIVHYDLHLTMKQISNNYITGVAELKMTPTVPGINQLVLDLQKLKVFNAYCNQMPVEFTQTDSTVRILLDTEFYQTDTFNVLISYGGNPVKDPRWGGYYSSSTHAFNMGVGMGSNPPTFGRCWFPCIDNFTDRATYDFQITTDSGMMAVCSGTQEVPVFLPGGDVIWKWKLRQAVPTYLVNVAVSNFVLLEWTFKSISGKTLPVILAVNPADTAKARASFYRLNMALDCFESRFGPYLFDRVGYVAVPFNSGAMEHACNISYPIYALDGTANYETLMAHELSHHWWGNLVTTRTAADMWLNEGWASYCEALFLECVYGKEAFNDKIKSELFESLRWAHVRDGGFMPVSGVPLAQTYGTHVYTKGGLVAHALRSSLGDSAFWLACKDYLSFLKFRDVSSFNLMDVFYGYAPGQNLITFFDSWVKDKGDVDLQLLSLESMGNEKYKVVTRLVPRHKTVFPDLLKVDLFLHYRNGSVQRIPLTLKYSPMVNWDGMNTTEFTSEINLSQVAWASLNDDHHFPLAKTWDQLTHKSTGVKNTTYSLLTYTVNKVNDSAVVYTEHHFAGPWFKPTDQPAGVRVSKERYWHVDGIWDSGFAATAFFNYDGSTPANKNGGFLDTELITGNEDSLVLLYRPDPNSPFTVETNLTFQKGPSTTDKMGRFWVNQLKKGDYVFGYRDVSAGLTSAVINNNAWSIYPNPADNLINVDLPFTHADLRVTVINALGDTCYEGNIQAHQDKFELNTKNFKRGTYFMVLHGKDIHTTKTFILK